LKKKIQQLQTTTTATTLSAGRVGGGRGNVLNAADLHAGTGQGTESRLGTGAGGLGTVTCKVEISLASDNFDIEFLI
jgi:hypothetical protein